METNPTTNGLLAELMEEVAAGLEAVFLSPRCIASFGGGSCSIEELLEMDLWEEGDFLMAVGENGKEWIVEV
jgi:hypothetical protein